MRSLLLTIVILLTPMQSVHSSELLQSIIFKIAELQEKRDLAWNAYSREHEKQTKHDCAYSSDLYACGRKIAERIQPLYGVDEAYNRVQLMCKKFTSVYKNNNYVLDEFDKETLKNCYNIKQGTNLYSEIWG